MPTDTPDAPVTYGSYLALDELLALQHPRSGADGGAEQPDELLFIVVHQASELWFKVLLHELDGLRGCLAERNAESALWRVQRLNALTRIVSSQLTALDTLPPQRFLQFRGYLGSSSGSQSVQFRAIEAASGLRDPHFVQVLREHGEIPALVQAELDKPALQDLFLGLLADAGVQPEELYTGPGPSTLFFLAEGLLEYEQQFARWRFAHVQLVERIIGLGTQGTGGTLGAKYLARTVAQRFFPQLWEVRSRLYGAARG
ncbi:tryptophan 2,3-dioxygenase family protein [Roseisolibacter sp. H3M3-2]|uniref:tryptophan 2,3-dioxygenase family protein n=1 Tax=Roseisolibacter sp. H3M3-2 TaxID=3031323 RepID=UPI0023DBBA56|nr:tryptophan 2,3-dioxygenase family protein [Roseisolibacter sp. H3M3-2]MDF1502671.1 tryptophan 2,3-dioxygenase family protein [Roseisolibacter sp. H3M3-2]